ncbi:MAG TPA: biopolymer transporter ExbD [Candidatus Limnocylindrales bacterium]|nr:biopolymer transporter ExbD [Candidatus Limnocylindrales bacterium]
MQRKEHHTLAEVNIIPLVDVVFVLLIIFMVTAPMMHRGIDVQLPQAGVGAMGPEEKLIITITGDRQVYLNDRPVSLEDLRDLLQNLNLSKPEETVYIRSDQSVPYGFVVSTIAKIKEAGIQKIGLVTSPVTSEKKTETVNKKR